MLRIVHLENAIKARGWSPFVRAEVALDVRDDVLDQNAGRWQLSVHDGAASVQRGGAGDAIIDIRGLAALYSGHLSPHDLIAWGRLSLADHVRDVAGVLAALQAIFAGPRPWMSDMF
jgi:predicted acetyltransferase